MALRFDRTDNDNCRVYYRGEARALYAFQEDRPGAFTLYRCSQDGEPSHEVGLIPETAMEGMPADDSSTARAFRSWCAIPAGPVTAPPACPHGLGFHCRTCWPAS